MFVEGLLNPHIWRAEKVPALVSSSPGVDMRAPTPLPAFVFVVSAGACGR